VLSSSIPSEEIAARLQSFSELVGTAISRAQAHAEVLASRARIVEAGDEARRRIERDLHDGTQQRLITLTLRLQRALAEVPPSAPAARAELVEAERELSSTIDEVQELSRGLHPAQLARGGLRPALRALARRSPIPVEVAVDGERLPASVETAVYYVVSEALTNAIKHSAATSLVVTVAADSDAVRATVADNGVGGAKVGAGSGLTGLNDRVEAIGGRFAVASPSGGGTTISVELPIAAQ
jgi:signal transduction histidine kinase